MIGLEWVKIRAVIFDTLLQARRKWVLISIFSIVTLILLACLFGIKTEKGSIDPSELIVSNPFTAISNTTNPVSFATSLVTYGCLSLLGYVGMFFFLFAFAGFLPESLGKGTSDLYLSKPIRRWAFLMTRVIVIYLLTSLLAGYYFVGMLLIAWLKSGYLATELFPAFFLVLFIYAAPLAIMVMLSVVGRSATLSVVLNLFVFLVSFLLYGLSTDKFRFEPKWLASMFKALYYIFPQYGDMGTNSILCARERDFEMDSYLHCAIFVVVAMTISIAYFNRKNYTT